MYIKIQELCDAHNITITELCRACGVNRSSISDLKFGRQKQLSVINLQKIASYFGITTEYFFDEPTINSNNAVTGNNNIIGNGNTVGLSAQEQALVDMFRKLDVIQQVQLIAHVAELTK